MHLAKLHVHSSVQIKIISIGNQFADVKGTQLCRIVGEER